MPVLKKVTTPNGADCEYNVLIKLEVAFEDPTMPVLLRVGSWRSEAEYLADNPKIGPLFNWTLSTSYLTVLQFPTREAIEAWLTTNPDSPFVGGSFVAPVTDLESAKQRRIAQLKQLRDAKEFSTFVWDGSEFDIDSYSQLRIQLAVQRASTALVAGQSMEIEWTLADNTSRVMSVQNMLALGYAMGDYINALHETCRQLRRRVEDATSPEEALSVDWPT